MKTCIPLIQFILHLLLNGCTLTAHAKEVHFPGPEKINSNQLTEVIQVDTIETIINASICIGQSYEGYSVEGTYTDHFVTSSGDDSIRILNLSVESCCKANSGVYGSSGELENGLSIAASPDNNSYYVAGIRADSVLLMKFDLNDEY